MIAPLPVSTADDRPTIPRVAALDGLRGVAVIGVLLFHADHLAGGFLGVDLFFTLSGFLITSLLLVEHAATGSISLSRFWVRRARRLLPAMLVVVVAAAALAPLVLRDDALATFRTQALATLAYVANWAEVARARDYWALFDQPMPLDHAWSLAIEEQFYVLWPLLVLAVGWLGRSQGSIRTRVRTLTVVGILLSLTATWLVTRGDADVSRAYYGTDTRAASILVGALLATATAGTVRQGSTRERAASVVAPLALTSVAASWFLLDGTERWLYRWGLSVHAVLVAAVIAVVVGPAPGVLGRALANRALVHVGVLSYGLYLWHWPVYLLLDETRTGLSGWPLTFVRLAVALGVAEASFRLVEAPIRHRGLQVPRPALAAVASMAVVALAVVALAWPRGTTSLPPVASTTTTVVAGEPDTETPPMDAVAVVGDSQAFTLAFHVPAELDLSVGNVANLGCGLSSRTIVVHGDRVARDRCLPILDEVVSQVEALAPDLVAVLSGVWEASDQVVDGEVVGFRDERWAGVVRSDLTATLEPLASLHPVVLLTTPCFAEGEQRQEYADDDIDARIAAYNDVLRSVGRELDLPVIDLGEHLCPGGQPVNELDGYTLRPDGVHFDEAGGRLVWPWLAERLQRAHAELAAR